MSDIEQRFVETMSSWLISLPHDLKVLFEAVDDENLPRAARELAVGAIIYVVSPNDLISADRYDSALSYCDDCLLLRLAAEEIGTSTDEDTEFYKSRFPEFFEPLIEELGICREAMGDLYDWMKSKVSGLRALEYKGKTVSAFLDDDEASGFLYEDGLAFRTEYDVDEDSLADSFKKASSAIALMQRRKDEEDRK